MITLQVIRGDTKSYGFSTDVLNWRYMIITGARCTGLTSNRTYKRYDCAQKAGERMLEKLGSVNLTGGDDNADT